MCNSKNEKNGCFPILRTFFYILIIVGLIGKFTKKCEHGPFRRTYQPKTVPIEYVNINNIRTAKLNNFLGLKTSYIQSITHFMFDRFDISLLRDRTKHGDKDRFLGNLQLSVFELSTKPEKLLITLKSRLDILVRFLNFENIEPDFYPDTYNHRRDSKTFSFYSKWNTSTSYGIIKCFNSENGYQCILMRTYLKDKALSDEELAGAIDDSNELLNKMLVFLDEGASPKE